MSLMPETYLPGNLLTGKKPRIKIKSGIIRQYKFQIEITFNVIENVIFVINRDKKTSKFEFLLLKFVINMIRRSIQKL